MTSGATRPRTARGLTKDADNPDDVKPRVASNADWLGLGADDDTNDTALNFGVKSSSTADSHLTVQQPDGSWLTGSLERQKKKKLPERRGSLDDTIRGRSPTGDWMNDAKMADVGQKQKPKVEDAAKPVADDT